MLTAHPSAGSNVVFINVYKNVFNNINTKTWWSNIAGTQPREIFTQNWIKNVKQI